MSRLAASSAAPAGSVDRAYVRALNRRYAWFIVGLAVFVLGMAGLLEAGMQRTTVGAAFLGGTILIYAGIGFLSRTGDEAEYYVAGRRVPAMYNGVATAADWMSTATFIGTAGVLFLQGFGGLAFILGWTGGYCLVALLLAPYLRRVGQYTVADFLAVRYGGTMPRLLGASAAIVISFVYVVAQLVGVGLIAAHLIGLGFEVGIFIGLSGVLVCSFLGGMRAVTWTQVAQYIVLILAYLVPVLWLSVRQIGPSVPLLSYGQQLAAVGAREAELLSDPREHAVAALRRERAAAAERNLQDVPAAMVREAQQLRELSQRLKDDGAPLARVQAVDRELRLLPRTEAEARERYRRQHDEALAGARPLAGWAPQALPHARGDPEGTAAQRLAFELERRNFVALVFCLMLGTAAMPHVLTRFYTTTTVAAARQSAGWALFFITLVYMAAPAIAVLVKFDVLNGIVGLPFEQLPAWLRRWSKLDPGLVGVEDINGDGILQLGELRLAADVIVLAAPEIGGLPIAITYLVAAGGLAAALSTADGLLLTVSSALTHDVYFRTIDPTAPARRRVMVSKVVVLVVALLAAVVASLKPANILQLVSSAFSIAASTLFPALVAGVFWRRANRHGACAAMLVGLAVCLYYMAVNLPLGRHLLGLTGSAGQRLWWGIDVAACGIFGAAAGLAALVVVSLVTPRGGADAARGIALIRGDPPP